MGRPGLGRIVLLCKSSDGLVPPDDHIKLICTATFWINPLVAPRSFFVCARKLAQKHTSIPAWAAPKIIRRRTAPGEAFIAADAEVGALNYELDIEEFRPGRGR